MKVNHIILNKTTVVIETSIILQNLRLLFRWIFTLW